MTTLRVLGPGQGRRRRRLRGSSDDAAALFRDVDWVPAASVAAHVGESPRAAVVLALAGSEGRALRGEEAVVGAGFDVRLGGEHVAARAWRGEGGGREGCDEEGELHGGGRWVLRCLGSLVVG